MGGLLRSSQRMLRAPAISVQPIRSNEATCSCGKQPAMHCNCEKSSTENKTTGARCSCNQRPAQACTCSRSQTENSKPSGSTCACGKRTADSCSCSGTEKGASSGGLLDTETDFTTKASGA
ncbi:hypothetical protein M8818_007433 [Zalaria obscura]|uniref:Uncharacterized protein n=1 Tax=Zalaria obscura TaxID=2024903 RepID=A0ACC3S4Z7_9PEZI